MKTKTPGVVMLGFAGALSLFSLLGVASSFGEGEQEFTLHNQAGKAIKEIYVGPSNSDRFGEDVTGKEAVRDGASRHITLHSGAPGNHWDLRIVFEDDTSKSWANVDLTTIKDVTISLKNGEPSATWK